MSAEVTSQTKTCFRFHTPKIKELVEALHQAGFICAPHLGKSCLPCQLFKTSLSTEQRARWVTVLGAQVVYLEAGFPYVDAGATASDTLDGVLTDDIWTNGDTVDVDQHRHCDRDDAAQHESRFLR